MMVFIDRRILNMYDICINELSFEWDDEKEKYNFSKHGIDFQTAKMVFADPNRIERYDGLHSTEDEDRFITIGMINCVYIIIALVYTERDEVIRIISSRRATEKERREYYEHCKSDA